MAKIKIQMETWTNSAGQVAISFPQQLGECKTDIFRQAWPAAVNASILLTKAWFKASRDTVFPDEMSFERRHMLTATRRTNFCARAERRFLKLFLAKGMEE